MPSIDALAVETALRLRCNAGLEPDKSGYRSVARFDETVNSHS